MSGSYRSSIYGYCKNIITTFRFRKGPAGRFNVRLAAAAATDATSSLEKKQSEPAGSVAISLHMN